MNFILFSAKEIRICLKLQHYARKSLNMLLVLQKCFVCLHVSFISQFSNIYLTILLFEPDNCVDKSLGTGAPTDKNQ